MELVRTLPTGRLVPVFQNVGHGPGFRVDVKKANEEFHPFPLAWGTHHVVQLGHRHGGIRGVEPPDFGSEGTGGPLCQGSAT